MFSARLQLEAIKAKHPGITYADLWSLAGAQIFLCIDLTLGAVAIESMGGPKISWRPGRIDKEGSQHCTPDGTSTLTLI